MTGPSKTKPDKYGLMPGQREALERAQNNRCLICGRPPKAVRLHVDHCHKCAKWNLRDSVRGLLCHRCNRGLFGEDPALLRKAAEYFAAHRCSPKPLRRVK